MIKAATKVMPDRPRRNDFRVTSFIVCDDVRREFNGKEILIGVYNNVIIFPAFPSTLASVIFRITLQTKKIGMKTLKFTIFDQLTKKTVVNSDTQFDFKPQDSAYVIGYGISGYPFIEPTTLSSTITIENEKHELPDVIVRLPTTEDERSQIR